MKTPDCRGIKRALITALLLISLPLTNFAQEGESLTYDPETGIYTVQYYNTYDAPTPILRRGRFELPTRIEPTVSTKIRELVNGDISFRYRVKNGGSSKQNLNFIQLRASQIIESSQHIPKGWDGGAHKYSDTPDFLVSWHDSAGLKPGESLGDLSISSKYLPGVSTISVWGRVRRDLEGFSDMGPTSATPVGKQYIDLINSNDGISRTTATPRIVVPTPFDAAAVLSGIQKHLNQDLVSMKLVDPVFASQLDRLLQTAVQAAKQGNTQGLRSNIQDLRRLLKREHEHVDKEDTDKDDAWDDDKDKPKPKLIDKLAAKVLDFDLKYVLKRVGEKS